MDNGLLKIDFVYLTSGSLTTFISNKSLHVVFLQLIRLYKHSHHKQEKGSLLDVKQTKNTIQTDIIHVLTL